VRGLDGVWRDANGNVVNVTQKLSSGRFFNLLEPSPADFEHSDLALGLSREARWGGQTSGEYAYSVAQHSILVLHILRNKYKIANKRLLLYGLLHDAEEGLGIKDAITGLKYVFGPAYMEVSKGIREAIHVRFQLEWPAPPDWMKTIKRADHAAGATEAVWLMNFNISDYRKRIKRDVHALPFESPWDELIQPWPPQKAGHIFLEELRELLSADAFTNL
jgi:hypothetical protein